MAYESSMSDDEFLKAFESGGFSSRSAEPAPMAPPLPEKSGAFRRVVGDTGVSALRGAIGLSEIPVGLADVVTGGAAGKGLESVGYRPKEAKAALSELYSPEQQAINRGMSESKGFLPTAAYMAANPSTIYHGIVESAPSMIGGAGIARGVVAAAPKVGGTLAGAIGEGTAMAGSSAERMRQESETGYLTPGTTLAALGTGLGGAAIGALGGKFAGSRGVTDVETALAKGALPTKGTKGFFRRVGEGAGIEGAEEFSQSSHETIMENLATGRPAFEGVPEAAAQGLMTGGVMGAGMNVAAGRAPKDLLKKESPAPSAPAAPAAEVPITAPMTTEELIEDARRQVAAMAPAQDVVSRPYAEEDVTGPTGVGTAAEAAETAERFRAAQDMEADVKKFVPGQKPETREEAEGRALAAKGSSRLTDADMAKIGVKTAKQKSEFTKLDLRRNDHFDQALDLLQTELSTATTPKKQAAIQALGERLVAQKIALDAAAAPKKAELDARRAEVNEKTVARRKRVSDLGERLMTEQNAERERLAEKAAMDEAIKFKDSVVASAAQKNIAKRRLKLLDSVLSNAKKKNKTAAFVDVLNKSGIADKTLSESEARLIERYNDAKAAFEAAPEAPARRAPTDPRAIPEMLQEPEPTPTMSFGKLNMAKPAKEPGAKLSGMQGRVAAGATTKGVSVPQRVKKTYQEKRAEQSAAKKGEKDAPEKVTVKAGVPVKPEGRAKGRKTPEAGTGDRVRPEAPVSEKEVALVKATTKAALPEKTDQTSGNYLKWLENVVNKARQEDWGQDVLDTMQENGESPQDVAERFWGETYSLMPEKGRKLFARLYKTHTGQALQGDGNPMDMVDLGDTADYLQGTDRGFVALMREANEQVDAQRKSVSEGKKSLPPVSEKEVTTDEKRIVAEDIDGRLAAIKDELTDPLIDDDTAAELRAEAKTLRGKANALGLKQSVTEKVVRGQTAEALRERLNNAFASPHFMNRSVEIHENEDALPEQFARMRSVKKSGGTQGFYDPKTKKVHLIADNIVPGLELSVVLHEVGVHMGMKNLLGEKNYDKLIGQVKEWVNTGGDAMEYRLAQRAERRVKVAKANFGEMSEAEADEELLAYFVEEAVNEGINPTAMELKPGTLRDWFRLLWSSIKSAVQKLGINPASLTPFDVVNLAYGAAQMELDTEISGGPGGEGRAMQSVKGTVDPDSPAAGVWARTGKALDEFFGDPVNALKVHGYGWLTLTQLAEVARKINPKVQGYIDTVRDMQKMSKEWVQKAATIDAAWAKVDDKDAMHDVMRAATRAGFDPAVDKPSVDIHQEVLDAYINLSDEAKAVYASARDYYKATQDERQNIMTSTLKSAFDERIAAAKGDAVKVAKYEKDLAEQVAKVTERYKQLKGPYFPLMRLGKWYSVGMSDELAALMEKDDKTKADEDKIAKLKKDEAHFVSRSFESRHEAKKDADRLKTTFNTTRFNTAAEKNQATKVLSAAGLESVDEYVNASFDAATAAKIREMMADLYYQSLPEHSALKSQMKREGIHGEEADMRRVFAVSTIRNAHYMSRLKYADDLRSSLSEIERAGKQGPDAMQVYNEVAKRAKLTMEETNTPWTDKLVTTSYLAHLGMSPAFILTNATQVPMITAPWLAARSTVAQATNALGSATATAYNIIKSSYADQGWRAELDWGGYKDGKWQGKHGVTEAQGKMLKALMDRSLLNITIEHDLGAVAELKHHKIGDALKGISLPVHVTELGNRTVTALAAYNLAVKDLKMGHEAAVDFATKAVSETQLDYTALNAPRHLQRIAGSASLAKIVGQFRKYQQGMLWLVAKSTFDAIYASGETPAETARLKREAKRTLLGLFTTTGVMAGSLGLPLAGTVTAIMSIIASAAGDDDEPWEAGTAYKNWLTEAVGADAAEAIAKGLPTVIGLDLSKRLGLSDIASPLPFARRGKTTQETTGNILTALGGAPLGTVVDTIDGYNLMREGQWVKGSEKIFPLMAAKNLIKAARFTNEGMTDSRRNVVLPPESFDLTDIFYRGAGFTPTKESTYYEANKAVEDAKAAAKGVRSKLLENYAVARIAGDDTSSVEQKIAEFNSRHPEKGARITYESRRKAVQQRKASARERNAAGVGTGRANRPYLGEAEFAG